MPGILVNLVVYLLFRSVQPTVALVALVLALTSTTVESVSLLLTYVPLTMIEESEALAGLGDEQATALSYLAVRLFSTGFGFGLLFFSGFCVLTGVLILRSRLVPRVLGALMVAAGAAYLINTLATILAPSPAARLVPAILLPSLIGELSLALWLLVKGVRATADPVGS